MNKAVFLDRDGTINVEKNYLYRIEDFEFLPGVINALKILQDKRYLLIIVTNQSGIARGYYTETEYYHLNNWLLERLRHEGIYITATYYCPHHPNAIVKKYRKICECRKPQLGMYNNAIHDYNIELSKSYSVGDKIRDCAICCHSLCNGFLIGENEKKNIIEKVKNGDFLRIRYCNDLLEAAKQIP